MKFLWYVLTCLLVLAGAGCTKQPGDDWYDQSVSGTEERETFIQQQVESGLSPEDARELHDRKLWEMNTINLSREGESEEPSPQNIPEQ